MAYCCRMVGVEMIAPVAFGESNIFVKLGKDLNTRAGNTTDLFLKIFGAFFTLKVRWISPTYNDRFTVLLPPQ